jgi:glycosyltransferase involved in cell wall biosynthesis
MKATCRVYLFTYKRNHLLIRAINSLLNQTFQNWVCELHNDSVEDSFPEQYIKQLHDNRFIIKNHESNLGGTKSFNLAFTGCPEKYASILEDDNWWEPDFLEQMINVMDSNPTINIAWSNMFIWREVADSNWANTGKTIWNETETDKTFDWSANRPAMAALHSNGAMIYKGAEAANYSIPDDCEFSIIEPVRERLFKFPIYLVIKPMANFSHTISTSRSNQKWVWTACQAMLLSSFIEAADASQQKFKETLAAYRQQEPSPLSNFFVAIFFILKKPSLCKFLTLKDWLIINKWLIRNIFNILKIKAYLKNQQNVYTFLKANTVKSP